MPTNTPSSVAAARRPEPTSCLAYVGTYAEPGGRGIYLYRLDLKTGALTAQGLAAAAPSPSFLAVDPGRRRLFAVGESGVTTAPTGGGVFSFAIDAKTGMLTLLSQVASLGNCPCHVTLDRTAGHVLVASYVSGTLEVLPIFGDGRLGQPTAFIQNIDTLAPNPAQRREPHAHSMLVDPANRIAFACDLGLDQVLVFRFDPAKGTLTPADPPFAALAPGAGPRHMKLDAAARHLYVINELNSTITTFAYDAAKGRLTELQTVTTLEAGVEGKNYTAEVVIHLSGRFVYGSNRGHDSIAIFGVDPAKATLKLIGHESARGKWPRGFSIDPTGRFLVAANQNSNNLAVFAVDEGTGRLTPAGPTVEVPGPACVVFVEPDALK